MNNQVQDDDQVLDWLKKAVQGNSRPGAKIEFVGEGSGSRNNNPFLAILSVRFHEPLSCDLNRLVEEIDGELNESEDGKLKIHGKKGMVEFWLNLLFPPKAATK